MRVLILALLWYVVDNVQEEGNFFETVYLSKYIIFADWVFIMLK